MDKDSLSCQNQAKEAHLESLFIVNESDQTELLTSADLIDADPDKKSMCGFSKLIEVWRVYRKYNNDEHKEWRTSPNI